MTRYTAPAAMLLAGWIIACSGRGESGNESSADPGSDPGTPGAGGSGDDTPPPPVSYGGGTLVGGEYGHFPTTVSKSDAESAYESFRANYVESCGANGLRVITRPDETLSEGIGHGALLAVGWDDRATFDGLLTYYQQAVAMTDAEKSAKHGLMGWLVWADPCSFQEIYTGANAAADLNMAMALLQAECQWGGSGYYHAAVRIIDSVRKFMTAEMPEGTALLPSDNGDHEGCMNPSYSAPGFYRVFAKAQAEQAPFWNKMADDHYVFLNLASDASTGLVGDWSPIGSSVCSGSTTYVGYDAIRTHWRAATDYVWFNTPAAKAWLDKVTGWVDVEVGADKLVDMQDGFFSDGSEILGDPNEANSAFLGAVAVGSIPVSQKMSDSLHEIFREVPPANDSDYYSVTARALYLMLSVNKFSPGCY